MSYSFAPDRTSTENARGMALAQIDRIEKAMTGDLPPAEIVHYARRRLKRVRASLALAASGFESGKVRAADRALRDLARDVAPLRDHDLVRAVSAGLRPLLVTCPEILPVLDAVDRSLAAHVAPADAIPNAASAIAGHRGTARTRRDVLPSPQAGLPATPTLDVERFARELARARRMIVDLPTADEDPEAPLRALVRIYRQARKSMATALGSGRSEDYHEWRKPAQRLARQLKLTAVFFDGRLNERQVETRLLARTLGEDHDLAVLQTWIAGNVGHALAPRERALIDGLVLGMQVVLRRDARTRGEALFDAPPAAFERLLRKLWSSRARERGVARSRSKD